MRQHVRALTLVAALAPLLALAGCAAQARAARVEIDIQFSHFNPSQLSVVHGQPVTFVLRNADPIDHEWIVGTEALHAAHRTGTEPYHAARPTEVTVPALQTRTTTVTFDEIGQLKFICHLPGHEAYGMVGTIEVT